jgi:hypothetical protein
MSDLRRLVGSWSSPDVAYVELVSVGPGEEGQGVPADYLGTGREWLPVREHNLVFAAWANVDG